MYKADTVRKRCGYGKCGKHLMCETVTLKHTRDGAKAVQARCGKKPKSAQ